MISFACPGCSKIFQVKDEFAGRTTTCRGCGQAMLVPSPTNQILVPVTIIPEHQVPSSLDSTPLNLTNQVLVPVTDIPEHQVPVVAIVIIAVLVTVVGVSLSPFMFFEPVSSRPTGVGRTKMTTNEFERLVIDKRGSEIIQAVGRPDQTQKSGGTEYWYYDRVAIDPISGKPASAQLVFPGDSSGWCRTANWH